MCWCGAKSADVVFCESDLCTMAREKAFQQEVTIPPLPADVRASLAEAEKTFRSDHAGIIVRSTLAAPEATTVQAKPQGKGPAILPLVVADLEARAHLGRQKYGEVLRAANGRDALTDAYQEALDLAMYLRQEIEDRRLAKVSASPSPISPISTMPPSIATPLEWWCQNCRGFRPVKYHRADMVCSCGFIVASFKVNDCIPAPRTQASPPAEAPEAEQPSLVVGNFRCSEHGPQVPIPACPHCIDSQAPEADGRGA